MSKTFQDKASKGGGHLKDGASVADRPRHAAGDAGHPSRAVPGPWTAPVRCDAVPDTGLHVDLKADALVLGALADVARVIAVSRAEASFDLSRCGEGLRVVGVVRGTVNQDCVVTLEPLENEIAEAVDVTFLPSVVQPADDATSGDPAIDPPEPLIDGEVDLGRLATECLLIGIDPYPRKPDARFTPPAAQETDAGPFAALAALKAAQNKDRKN